MTLVPRKQALGASRVAPSGAPRIPANFSTGIASPVSTAWLMNRSLLLSSRTSAGIMSPAASWIMSPGTSRSIGISLEKLILGVVAKDGGGHLHHRAQPFG